MKSLTGAPLPIRYLGSKSLVKRTFHPLERLVWFCWVFRTRRWWSFNIRGDVKFFFFLKVEMLRIFWGGYSRFTWKVPVPFTEMCCDNGKLLCEGPMILNFDDSYSNEHMWQMWFQAIWRYAGKKPGIKLKSLNRGKKSTSLKPPPFGRDEKGGFFPWKLKC